MTRHNRSAPTTTGPRAAVECLGIGEIVARARALDALDGRLRRLLPPAMAAETRLGDVRDGRVVLLASSPAWATRVRMHQSALLAEARAILGDDARHFAVKVARLPAAPPETAPAPPLSAAAAHHLRAAAAVLKDAELRDLCLQMASLAGRDEDG